MSFYTGEGTTTMNNFGDSDSWGGPVDGIDVMNHITGSANAVAKSTGISEDGYAFIIMILALAGLWLLGGVVFKSVRH